MGGNDRDNRPRSDRQYREGLMTGLLIALANQVGQGWSMAIIIGHTGTAWSESQARPLIRQRNSRNL
jgi:hypothetical protein